MTVASLYRLATQAKKEISNAQLRITEQWSAISRLDYEISWKFDIRDSLEVEPIIELFGTAEVPADKLTDAVWEISHNLGLGVGDKFEDEDFFTLTGEWSTTFVTVFVGIEKPKGRLAELLESV